MTYQKITLIGFLGHPPSLKTLESGTVICNLAVAVTEKVKKGNEYADKTTWFDVTTFGKTAESCKNYLNTGSQVYIEGAVDIEVYTAKDGTAKGKLKVVANVVKFLGSPKKQEGVVKESLTTENEPSINILDLAKSQKVLETVSTLEDDDIPF